VNRTTLTPSALITEAAQPISGARDDYDALVDRARTARLVLIGESTHGTLDFYRERIRITRRLIEEHRFAGVAIEGDWPDSYRVHRYVQGRTRDTTAEEALRGFHRFPAWMWRNTEMLDFVAWLREHNDRSAAGIPVGVYGMDLYSLHASIEAVLGYLDRVDPAAAARARARYSCFELFGHDPQAYGHAAGLELSRNCEDEVVAQLQDLRHQREVLVESAGLATEEEYFVAEQNARVVRESERYYREIFHGQVTSWNLRDTHMADTLDALLTHLGRQWEEPRLVVWAHNSHIGDARATEMERLGELNMGQLVRARYGEESLLIGFSTYGGTVTAARDWGEPAGRRWLRPGLPGSCEELLHQANRERFLLDFSQEGARESVQGERSFRAVGVVYRPETERRSHYIRTHLADQFDLLIHIDETEALQPLEPSAEWERGELPETYPFGV
jgi:erythromycin esterase-like protein